MLQNSLSRSHGTLGEQILLTVLFILDHNIAVTIFWLFPVPGSLVIWCKIMFFCTDKATVISQNGDNDLLWQLDPQIWLPSVTIFFFSMKFKWYIYQTYIKSKFRQDTPSLHFVSTENFWLLYLCCRQCTW